MNDELALLAALQDDPGDDTTWLVLSDLLEEQGRDAQAELIRLLRSLRAMDDDAREQAEAEVQARLLAGVRPVVPMLVNSIGMDLALIPAGTFRLGSPPEEEGRYDDEGPRRLIRITRPFYLGVTPVTQGQYEAVMGFNPSAFSAGEHAALVAGVDTSRHPVERVNWGEAMAFCRTLGEMPAEKKAGRVYRLPTEAEWEYACRGEASQSSPYVFGKELTADHANFRALPGAPRDGLATTPVGKYPPNSFGLYDMMGNVWEWCADWYDTEAYLHNPRADPTGPATGDRRNVRGGTHHTEWRRIRSADRSSFAPEHRDSDLGFRVLCEW